MGCSNPCHGEAKEPEGAHVKSYENRSCTDILFLLVWLAAWLASIIVFSDALASGGNPDKIIYPVDTYGRICGVDEGVADKPYGIWPMPYYDQVKICAKSCDESDLNEQELMITTFESSAYTYYCIPTDFTDLNSTVDSLLGDSVSSSMSRSMGDLYTAYWVVIVAIFLALIISFAYAKGLKLFGTFLVYLGFGIILLMGLLLGYSLVEEAADQRNGEYADYADAMEYTGYGIMGVTALFALVMFCLRSRVKLAIEIVKEAGSALADMPQLIFFPIIPAILGACYVIYWIFVSLYIFSVSNTTHIDWPVDLGTAYAAAYPISALWNPDVPDGEPKWNNDRDTYIDYTWDTTFEPYFAFHFFHLLWIVQFLIYFNYMVVAGAISHWYFTSEGDRKAGHTDASVSGACKQTCRYHLGSVAVGSLIIAIIQFIRAMVKYIEEQAKAANGGQQNKLQKAVFCAIQCCLKCVECCLDKINKNAYCWIAIWGDSYFPAACSSFQLIWANMARAAIVTMVGDYLLIVGKGVIALATTAICAMIMYGALGDELNSLILPSIVCFMVSLMIAHLFMVEFDTTIDTIFMCFLVDEKFNKGVTDMYASKELQKILHVDNDHFKKEGDEAETKKEGDFSDVAMEEAK